MLVRTRLLDMSDVKTKAVLGHLHLLRTLGNEERSAYHNPHDNYEEETNW